MSSAMLLLVCDNIFDVAVRFALAGHERKKAVWMLDAREIMICDIFWCIGVVLQSAFGALCVWSLEDLAYGLHC